jgi:hypothetical protein
MALDVSPNPLPPTPPLTRRYPAAGVSAGAVGEVTLVLSPIMGLAAMGESAPPAPEKRRTMEL